MWPLHIHRRLRSTIYSTSTTQSIQVPLYKIATELVLSVRSKVSLNLASSQDFTTSYPGLKRGGKQNSKHNAEVASVKVDALAQDEPYDLSDLESRLKQILLRLRNGLAELRPGGRFNPKTIEDLRVQLAKGNRETVRLGDLAQVVPKGGRSIVLYVGEQLHVKPISSSILSSPLSLNPQLSSTSPLELNIQIPPPTAESRKQTVMQALKAGTDANGVIRMARGAHQKKLRAMGLAKSAGPDDLKRAHDKMERAVEKANLDAKNITEEARKVLEIG